MTNDVDIKMMGDAEIMRALTRMDYKLQHKLLKRIVGDAAQKKMVKPLQSESPVASGTLKKSIGKKSGRSKKNAIVFVGPRMGGNYKGFIANIIEFNKGKERYPGVDKKTGRLRKRPSTPQGLRRHSGVMPTTHKGFIKRTIERNIKPTESYLMQSIRTIIEKEWRKAR